MRGAGISAPHQVDGIIQRHAANCGDEDEKCVDETYASILRSKRSLAAFRRSFRVNCGLTLDLEEKKKPLSWR